MRYFVNSFFIIEINNVNKYLAISEDIKDVKQDIKYVKQDNRCSSKHSLLENTYCDEDNVI